MIQEDIAQINQTLKLLTNELARLNSLVVSLVDERTGAREPTAPASTPLAAKRVRSRLQLRVNEVLAQKNLTRIDLALGLGLSPGFLDAFLHAPQKSKKKNLYLSAISDALGLKGDQHLSNFLEEGQ